MVSISIHQSLLSHSWCIMAFPPRGGTWMYAEKCNPEKRHIPYLGLYESAFLPPPPPPTERFSNFKLLMLVRNSTYVPQILCGLSYNQDMIYFRNKIWNRTELLILILDIPPLYTSCLVAMLLQHQILVYKAVWLACEQRPGFLTTTIRSY